MTPEALRRRMAHGNIYPPEKIDAALANYFRPGNLAALRELALLWVADQVDEALEEYRERHGITEPWETRERVVVAITGAPGTEALIRRAARMAQRAHGELLGVHVRADDGLAGPTPSDLRRSTASCSTTSAASTTRSSASDVAAALVEFARGRERHPARARREPADRVGRSSSRGSVINRVVRLVGPDRRPRHLARADRSEQRPLPSRRPRPAGGRRSPRRRQLAGWVLAVVGLPLLTLVLVARARRHRPRDGAAAVPARSSSRSPRSAGSCPASSPRSRGFLLANWYFTPPFHTLDDRRRRERRRARRVPRRSARGERPRRRGRRAAIDARRRARAEAETLARLAADVGARRPAAPALVDHIRRRLRARRRRAAARPTASGWVVEAAAGDAGRRPARRRPTPSTSSATASCSRSSGRASTADDRQVLNAFAAQLAAAVDSGRLSAEAATRDAPGGGQRAAHRAAAGGVARPAHAARRRSRRRRRACAARHRRGRRTTTPSSSSTIDDETDRLTALVGNLLDMSRLQAGALQPALRAVGLDEVVPAALASLGDRAPCGVDDRRARDAAAGRRRRRAARAGRRQPRRQRDRAGRRPTPGAGRGRRVARPRRPPGRRPRAGHRPREREQVFQPFQRLGDVERGTGVGLGLAVARGFVEAMGGELSVDDTPGGGTTVDRQLCSRSASR